MRLRTGMSERSLEAERGVPISPPPAELRRAVSAVRQRGQEMAVQRSASCMHERLGPQQTRWGLVICTGSSDQCVLPGAAADQVGLHTCAGSCGHCVLPWGRSRSGGGFLLAQAPFTMVCLHLLDQLAACCACRAEETQPLPASFRLRDTLRVRAKNLGWAPDRVGAVSATSPFREAGAGPLAPTTPEQESKGGLPVQASDGGPQTQVGLDLL